MKIAFIGLRMFPASQPGVSGIDVRGEKIINYFSKTNSLTVYIRSWVKYNKQKHNSIIVEPIFTFKNKYFDTLIYSLLASVRVSFSNFDFVFYEGTSSTLFSFLPWLFKKKVIVTIHAQEFLRSKWNFFGRLLLLASEYIGIKIANKIVCVSYFLSNYIKNKYGKHCELIPYYFKYKKNKPTKLLQKFKLKKNKYILYLGRFTEEKRVDWLIRAFKEINPANTILVLVGGNVQDVPYVQYLERLIGNNKKIKTLGYIFGEEKEVLISNCKLFVSPSSIEGCSLALIEALNFKKPILVSASNIFVNKLNKHNELFVFKSDDYNDFKKKLKKITFNKTINFSADYFTSHLISQKDFFLRYSRLIK